MGEDLPMMTENGAVPQKKKRFKDPSKSSDVDSGWAWVVLVAAFCMFILGNGAQFAFGVMYSSILRHFKTSKATTSWILLLQRGTGRFFGVFAGSLAKLYGFRFVMITGALLASFGFIFSYWVNNIVVLFLTMGLLVGIGDTMIMLASLV